MSPLVFVDIETTGISPRRGGRVLELGAIRVEAGQIVAKINQLIDPEMVVPAFITGMTGISNDSVVGAPNFEAIAPEFMSIAEDAVFVAHNVGFDYGFLQHEMARLGVDYRQPRLCTVMLSRALYPGERWHSLGAVIERHGYQVAARHRAYDDAMVLRWFVRDMLAQAPDIAWPTMQRLIRT